MTETRNPCTYEYSNVLAVQIFFYLNVIMHNSALWLRFGGFDVSTRRVTLYIRM